jgi:N-acetylmuramoyl-L-alanine amidase
VQLALTDLASKAFTDASIRLAKAVQGTLHNQVRAFNSESRNLGVKPSLFYVLLGARMPAILVETSFISNSKEGKLLRTPKYQGHIADAISRALIRYLGKSRDS